MNSYQQNGRNQAVGIKEKVPLHSLKEIIPGFFEPLLRPRVRARGRYAEAGAAADELIAILGGRRECDHGTWAYCCYHHDMEIILEKARECASMYRQGELRNPVTAFQKWLKKSYGKEAT